MVCAVEREREREREREQIMISRERERERWKESENISMLKTWHKDRKMHQLVRIKFITTVIDSA